MKTNAVKASYLWSWVNAVEGPEAIFFDFGLRLTKLCLDKFDEIFCGKIFLREAEWIDSTTRIFTKKFGANAEGLNPPAHPSFYKICAL